MKVAIKEKDTINSSFSESAVTMMKKRYLIPDDNGGQESPADMFERVADALAHIEKNYSHDNDFIEKTARDFFDIMGGKEFTPAGRTLTNAGGETPIIANCIVLPIHDAMESIFQTLKDAALLQQAGCGLGFDLTELRPAYAHTKKSRGKASGPVSFLKVYDAAFGTIKQQGRHGANMAMMQVDHPDILDFIRCKTQEGEIRNFNITVKVTDEFMKAVEKDRDQQWYCRFNGKKIKPHKVLRHPNGAVYGHEEIDITVGELYDKLVHGAWLNGEPGIAFIDTINATNPLPGLGPIPASNPCGEQYLHAYDNCNLGSINLAKFVKGGKVNWDRLEFVTKTAVRLMDNVIDSFDFPVALVTETALKNRRIGLGIMGFADMLYQLGVKYDSEKGLLAADEVMSFIKKAAEEASQSLAKEKGAFPNIDKSVFKKQKIKMRNAALTTVAPTGSISMMFDTSSGIEPNFALAYIKQDKDGVQYPYFNPYFKEALNKLDMDVAQRERIKEEIIERGTIQHLDELPQSLKDTFVVAMDISSAYHVKMQAAFQKNVDNSISKTINLPNEATEKEVSDSFMMAWKLKCKSCTVYRDGSRKIQILNIGDKEKIVSTTESTLPTKDKPKEEPIIQGSVDTKDMLEFDRRRIAPRKRPAVISGKTYRMKTGYGTLYITVNDDEQGVPFEVFAMIGKSGGFMQEQSEAICRLISLSLRAGIKVEEIIDHLKGIRGPMPVFSNGGTILSLPDAIGRVLEDHVRKMPEVERILHKPEGQDQLPLEDQRSIADHGFMPGCPECGSELVMAEGCVSCKMCGFSRCS